MPPSRRTSLVGPRLVLAAFVCVAGVLYSLFAGAAAAPAARPTDSAVHGAVARLVASGPEFTHLPAVPCAKSTAASRDDAARLAGDTPDGRDERASRRASSSPPEAGKTPQRPLDTSGHADIDVSRWVLLLAGSGPRTADAHSGGAPRRRASRPSAIERDVHAPRGPPSNLPV